MEEWKVALVLSGKSLYMFMMLVYDVSKISLLQVHLKYEGSERGFWQHIQ